MSNYSDRIYAIGDFNFHTMVPQHSIEERRMEKVLRKFNTYIPLFYISPADANNLNALAIRLHIYVGESKASWNSSQYEEFRAIVPRDVFAAATDEDIARWVHKTIQSAQNGKNPPAFTMETLVENYWRRIGTLIGSKILLARQRILHNQVARRAAFKPIKVLLKKSRQKKGGR